jgi:hypothetical protein
MKETTSANAGDDAHNPYAPPRVRGAASTSPESAPAPVPGMHGGACASIARLEALPLVCLKCGATSAIAVRPRHVLLHGGETPATRPETRRPMKWVAPAVFLGLSIAFVLPGSTKLLVPLLLAAGVAVPIMSHLGSRALLDVPLCAHCIARWRNGIVARGIALAGIFVGVAVAWLGMHVAGGVAIAASLALLVAAKVAKRILGAVVLPEGHILLLGLAPTAAEAIAEAQATQRIGTVARRKAVARYCRPRRNVRD